MGEGSFQVQIMVEGLDDFGGQGQDAGLASLAEDAQLGIGELQILELEGQDLTRTQAIQEHQAHQGEIAESAEATQN